MQLSGHDKRANAAARQVFLQGLEKIGMGGDTLFVGTSEPIDIQTFRREIRERLAELGIVCSEHDFGFVRVEHGNETSANDGLIDEESVTRIAFKGQEPHISISAWETEAIPGYPSILDSFPFTSGIWIWSGADIINRALAGCAAAVIANHSGSRILDPEHKWVDQEECTVDDFMARLKQRFRPPFS